MDRDPVRNRAKAIARSQYSCADEHTNSNELR
jgi:hypothetical protein